MKIRWKGWLMYTDGNQCVATNTRQRHTVKLAPLASDQHAFYRATEELKDVIRQTERTDRTAPAR